MESSTVKTGWQAKRATTSPPPVALQRILGLPGLARGLARRISANRELDGWNEAGPIGSSD